MKHLNFAFLIDRVFVINRAGSSTKLCVSSSYTWAITIRQKEIFEKNHRTGKLLIESAAKAYLNLQNSTDPSIHVLLVTCADVSKIQTENADQKLKIRTKMKIYEWKKAIKNRNINEILEIEKELNIKSKHWKRAMSSRSSATILTIDFFTQNISYEHKYIGK